MRKNRLGINSIVNRMVGNRTFQNVHIYDSKVKGVFSSITYSIEEKNRLFEKLISELTNKVSIGMVRMIQQDMKHPKGGQNFAHTDNIDASDLLADILTKNYQGTRGFLEEQLQDNNQLGRCPSGRVIRLIQIWRSLASENLVFKNENEDKILIEKLGNSVNLFSPNPKIGSELGVVEGKDFDSIEKHIRELGFYLYKSESYSKKIGAPLRDSGLRLTSDTTKSFRTSELSSSGDREKIVRVWLETLDGQMFYLTSDMKMPEELRKKNYREIVEFLKSLGYRPEG